MKQHAQQHNVVSKSQMSAIRSSNPPPATSKIIRSSATPAPAATQSQPTSELQHTACVTLFMLGPDQLRASCTKADPKPSSVKTPDVSASYSIQDEKAKARTVQCGSSGSRSIRPHPAPRQPLRHPTLSTQPVSTDLIMPRLLIILLPLVPHAADAQVRERRRTAQAAARTVPGRAHIEAGRQREPVRRFSLPNHCSPRPHPHEVPDHCWCEHVPLAVAEPDAAPVRHHGLE